MGASSGLSIISLLKKLHKISKLFLKLWSTQTGKDEPKWARAANLGNRKQSMPKSDMSTCCFDKYLEIPSKEILKNIEQSISKLRAVKEK